MGRKLGFTSIFHKTRGEPRLWPLSSSMVTPSPPSWPWPSCKQPKTESFRLQASGGGGNDIEKKAGSLGRLESGESCFTDSISEKSESFSTASEASSVEAVIRKLQQSDRLFFEPGGTSSIMDGGGVVPPPEGSLAMEVDSEDLYKDFRASMEEMVVAHGVMSWWWLEELLGWYLMANARRTHGYILGAFVDVLVMLSSSSPSSSSSSNSISMEKNED